MVGSSNRVESFPDATDLEASQPFPTPSLTPLQVHSVSVPQEKTTFQSLKQRLGEVFFPDDPLHQFKNKSFLRKMVLALHYFFPIFQWGSDYHLKLLKSDAISGVTIANSSFVPPLIYSVLGSSRDLAVGPVSIASLVMGSMLRDVVSPDKEPTLYLQLAFTATFFAGVFQASLGLLRQTSTILHEMLQPQTR
ncbi:hypothetical protein BHM03_00061464 [Ensete ventricosum]|uniref:SLC26A/SulP transporter domain-containing protein n=1 Tax=Ensete ventricosum TaxID=4639 RepID=A0A426X6M5_ENSVE|nr:hypothetical protein B296_00056456 [Ensete ventricosum]RZS27928.1 hypothetical protein BHM03_00061464 [Ensete ventricosum]